MLWCTVKLMSPFFDIPPTANRSTYRPICGLTLGRQFTITIEILARSLANFHHQQGESYEFTILAIRQRARADSLTIRNRREQMPVFHAFVLLMNSSKINRPMAIKNSVPMTTHSFPVPHLLDFNMLVIFISKNVKRGHKLNLTYL